jgi:hypothetical protein
MRDKQQQLNLVSDGNIHLVLSKCMVACGLQHPFGIVKSQNARSLADCRPLFTQMPSAPAGRKEPTDRPTPLLE